MQAAASTPSRWAYPGGLHLGYAALMKRFLSIMTACACALAGGSARAEDKGASIYLDMHGALVNQYYFRGLRQGSKGVVMQGAADLRFALYDEDELKFQTVGGAFISSHPGDKRN